MKYDLEYFIAKFEGIPEHEWCTGTYISADGLSKCAYGHCGVRASTPDTDEEKGLDAITGDIEGGYYISLVNDNKNDSFSEFGSTPKERVINYLKSLRK